MECNLCHHDHGENDGTCRHCSAAKKVIKGNKSTTAKLATLIEMGWKHAPEKHKEEVPKVIEIPVGCNQKQVRRTIIVATLAGAMSALLIASIVRYYL